MIHHTIINENFDRYQYMKDDLNCTVCAFEKAIKIVKRGGI